MCLVLVILKLKPFDSKVCLHSSKFLLTPVRLYRLASYHLQIAYTI
uniref:Uncharacterized protein n=1 Tax=Arundo donax TaxID=35708 RepID=A0A0A9CCJ3_ARUDO